MTQWRILVVDDSVLVRHMHSVFLSEQLFDIYVKIPGHKGVAVEYATNGREGLNKLIESKGGFDLIILDLEMPEMTGFEFLAARGRDPRCAKIPAIVVTSLCDAKIKERVRNAGGFRLVSKPFEPEPFYEAIKDALTQAISAE